MSDLISREAALNCFHDWVDQYGDVHTPDEIQEYQAIEALPGALNRRKISEAIYMVYKNKSCHMSAEGVVATNYYLAEIWREVFGEEAPIWLKN